MNALTVTCRIARRDSTGSLRCLRGWPPRTQRATPARQASERGRGRARPQARSSGGLGCRPQPALAGPHPDALHGVAALLRQRAEAEVAQVAALLQLVETLARQGSTPAAAAVGGRGLQRADA